MVIPSRSSGVYFSQKYYFPDCIIIQRITVFANILDLRISTETSILKFVEVKMTA